MKHRWIIDRLRSIRGNWSEGITIVRPLAMEGRRKNEGWERGRDGIVKYLYWTRIQIEWSTQLIIINAKRYVNDQDSKWYIWEIVVDIIACFVSAGSPADAMYFFIELLFPILSYIFLLWFIYECWVDDKLVCLQWRSTAEIRPRQIPQRPVLDAEQWLKWRRDAHTWKRSIHHFIIAFYSVQKTKCTTRVDGERCLIG